jgi:hypothetical protein
VGLTAIEETIGRNCRVSHPAVGGGRHRVWSINSLRQVGSALRVAIPAGQVPWNERAEAEAALQRAGYG